MSFSDNPVQCDYPLPEPEFQDTEFGTWDLGPRRGRYLITTDGRLRLLRPRVEQSGQHGHPPDAEDKSEDTNFHGDISLYASTTEGRLEYRVRFTHGTVEWIRREEDEFL